MAKKGIPSASNFDRIMTPKTGKPSTQQRGLICELLADLRRTTPPDGAGNYTSRAMQDGIDREPEARRFYEFRADADVRQVGFCTTDDGRFGCSPDGLVGDLGGLELKCPEEKTHIAYLLDGGLPDDYKPQVHGALIVSSRPWWDFMSYAANWPPLIVRVKPDAYTLQLRVALELFWKDFVTAHERVEKLEVAA